MPDLTTRIQRWVAAKLADAIVKLGGWGVGAVLSGAAALAWAWVWFHVNPQFTYEAQPSSLPSHFVGLGQVLSQIDKDSQFYCTGGWDQRLAELALRKCYRFRFEPQETYRMTACTRDERSISVVTTDQLLALQHFERALRPRECFAIVPQPSTNEYVVRLGKDAKLVELQFASDAPQSTAFCGCSASDVADIARTVGAKLK